MEFTKFLAVILGCYVTYYLIAFLSELMSMKPQLAGEDAETGAVHYEVEKPEEIVREVVSDVEDTLAANHGNRSSSLSQGNHTLPGFDLEMEQFSKGIVVEPEEFSKLRMM